MDLILYILAIAVTAWSQFKVTNAYNRYKKIENGKRITGAQVARQILDLNGLGYVKVENVQGVLKDHYDPSAKVVRLSDDIYYDTSIASIAVAAHECGHAIQHAENYGFIAMRNSILPITSISSNLAWPLLMVGLMFSIEPLVYFGIILLTVVMIFQVITLPIEINASSRAMTILNDQNMIEMDEKNDVKNMLSAAAFTYIATVIASALQILRLLLIANRRRR